MQFQNLKEKIIIRRHNQRAFQFVLHKHKIKGTELDFIDPDKRKVANSLEVMHQQQAEAERRLKEELLKAQEKANNGAST